MTQKKALVLIGNSAPAEMAKIVGQKDGFKTIPASIGFFDSGEPFVELFRGEEAKHAANAATLQNTSAYVVQSTGEPVGERLAHLLMMAHSLKHYGAREVTAVIPFAAFDRQDREFKNRFPSVAAELMPKLLKAAGVDKVIIVTPHSQDAMRHYKNEFGANYTALSATELLANDIKSRFGGQLQNLRIGAPDGADKLQDEGQIRAKGLIQTVFDDDVDIESKRFKISKVHTGVSETKITHFAGDVESKDCIIVDDMISGGSTMINGASLLKAKGAASVTAYATHGILSDNALENILSAKFDGMHPSVDRLVLLDTIPEVTKKLEALRTQKPRLAERVSIVSVAPMLFQEMERQQAVSGEFAKRTASRKAIGEGRA